VPLEVVRCRSGRTLSRHVGGGTGRRTARGESPNRPQTQQQREVHRAEETVGEVGALLERRGFAAVLAARLLPGVPATALHYACGMSPARTRAFAGAIAVGALLWRLRASARPA